MPSKLKSIVIRFTLLVFVAAILFVVLSPKLYFLQTPSGSTFTLHYPDVSIDFESDGAQRVRVDGEEVLVPKNELQTHPVAREAWRRIIAHSKTEPQYKLNTRQVIRLWLPPVVLLYLLLFPLWAKGRDYITG